MKRAYSNGNTRVPKRARTNGGVRKAPQYATPTAGELKFHDVDLDDAVVAAAGTIVASINLIPQGVTEITRIGRLCRLARIGWRYHYSLPTQDAQALPATGDILRMVLYKDKQSNGATATVTGILESADYQSFNNLANQRRFMILMDRTVSINYDSLASDGAGIVSSNAQIRAGAFYKTCNIPLEFDGATGAITELRSDNLGVLLISKNGICGFNSKFRLRFKDG